MGKYAIGCEPIPACLSRRPRRPRRLRRFRSCPAVAGEARRGRALGRACRLHRLAGRDRPVRARFGAGVAAFDADGDGRLDLYLTSAVVRTEGGSRRLAPEQGGRPISKTPRDRSGCPRTAPAWASPRPTSTPTATSTFSSPESATTGCSATATARDSRTSRRRSSRRPAGPVAHGPLARPGPGWRPRPLRRQLLRGRARRQALHGAGPRRPGWPTRSTATTASPDRSPAAHAPSWAPVAVAVRRKAKPRAGFSIALVALDRRLSPSRRAVGAYGDRRARHRQRPRPRPGPVRRRGRRRSRCSTTGWASSTRSNSRPAAVAAVSGLLVTDFDADGRTDVVAEPSEWAGRSPGETPPLPRPTS